MGVVEKGSTVSWVFWWIIVEPEKVTVAVLGIPRWFQMQTRERDTTVVMYCRRYRDSRCVIRDCRPFTIL